MADWGYDCPVTVQKIVAMSREGGAYAYPIDGGQIGAMAKEGFLRRDGNLVWVDRTCRTGAGALNDEFENLKAALFGSAV